MKTRVFINQLHFYLALVAALPILVLCLSGTILVFKESIDNYFTRPYTQVEAKETKLPIAEMVERLEKEIPGKTYAGVVFPPEEGQAYFFWMKESDFWTVAYIDPYTGAFKGVRDWYDISWANLIWWVTELHTTFRWGTFGGYLVAASSFVLLFSVLSGIYLWWPKGNRFGRHKFKLKLGKRWKQSAFNLHGVLGIYAAGVLIIITLTGIGLSFMETIQSAAHTLTATEAPKDPDKKAAVPGVPFLTTEELVARARRHLKETYDITPNVQSMSFPTEENAIVEFGFQGALEYAAAAHSHVWMDAQSGEVVGTETKANMSGPSRFLSWLAPVHYGTWGEVFGTSGDWFTRIVWLAAVLMPLFLMVSGFSIVKKKRWDTLLGKGK